MATIGEWAKVYGTGNYADRSKRIGTAVEDAIGQNRARMDRMRDEQDRQRKMDMEDYAMEQMKMREYSGLIVPRMSDYDSIETHFQDAANFLPDAYANIENDKSLSSSQRARGKAEVLAEVGALKASKAQMTAMVMNYQQGLNNDRITGYNPMSALDFANTLITPNNDLRVEGRDNGNFLVGKTIGGEKVDVSLKDTDKLPFDVTNTSSSSVIADIIMQPEDTELLKYAKSLGRPIHYGKYMIESQIDLVNDFLKIW